ncbi:MAG: adenylate/guanylate cyclase domain-containing protein [Deltaproteobacteria bacterium]|nr:adenylate/guanylate cyclase domain-containing protein [Deltaproteobacteria bacterium]
MQIAFKYRLSFSISLIVIVILTGVFVVLHADIEEDVTVRIKEQLTTTQEMVSDLIEERRTSLYELAAAAGRSEAVHDLLTEAAIGSAARDNIVEKLILPDYPRLNLLCVINRNGNILATNTTGRRLQASLIRTKAYKTALKGRSSQGLVFVDGQCIQFATIPIRIDSHSAEQAGGMVLVGMNWTETDLERILDLSGARIALFEEGISVLSTGMPFRREDIAYDLEGNRPRSIWQIATWAPTLARVNNERFVFLKLPDGRGISPNFIIAKSLDIELTFVDQILSNMVIFGLAGIGLGIGVSLFFGLSVSRPLQTLVKATEKIEAGDYGHRVPVNGRDEFSQLSLSFNRMVTGLQERDYIRNTFGRYIDPQVARELLQHPESAALGGEKRDVPIILCDIRGFTTICEELSPAATLRWLNAYFSHMIALINKHHGIIIDFVGDAVLLFFNPLEGTLADAAGRAVQCAFDMQQQIAVLNAKMDTTSLPEVHIGIGINAGSVIVGNIGSEDRRKYGIVGSAVNITQRIQVHAGPDEIVVSKALFALTKKRIQVLRRLEAPLKGIREPVTLYTIAPAEAASQEEKKHRTRQG